MKTAVLKVEKDLFVGVEPHRHQAKKSKYPKREN